MGILGLRKFIDTSACQKYVQNLLFGEEDANNTDDTNEDTSNNSNSRSTTSTSNTSAMAMSGGNDALRSEIMKHYASAGLLKQLQRHLDSQSNANEVQENKQPQQQKQEVKTTSINKKATGGARKSLVEVPEVDHVCVDMNSIIHSALSAVQRGEGVSVAPENMNVNGGSARQHLEEEVIATVIAKVKELVTGTVRAKKSISLCIDGPAPLAKLHTQRLRRRRLRFVDIREKGELTSLDITAGSDFLVRLENRIAAEFQKNDGCGFLLPPAEQLRLYQYQQNIKNNIQSQRGRGGRGGGRGNGGGGRGGAPPSSNSSDSPQGSRYAHFYCPVYLYGSCCIGEGEAKISRALAFIATRSEHLVSAFATPTPNSARYGAGRADIHHHQQKKDAQQEQRVGRNPRVIFERAGGKFEYNPQDSVVIIGNDIDLVLTALATTQYHNIYVLSPATLQVTSVGDIISRWLLQLSVGSGIFLHEARQLASARIDFVFLFLLNGGDHYVGLGEVAASLWSRYRTVRARYGKATLVSRTLLNVSVEFLSDVVQADTYTGEADAEVGEALIRAALWSLHTLVTGRCPNYRFLPGEDEDADPAEDGGMTFNKLTAPNINHVRAALVKAKHDHRPSMSTFLQEEIMPLRPLETYVALMPTEAMWPENIQRALLEYDTIATGSKGNNEGETTATTTTTTMTSAGDKKKLALATAKCLLESNDASAIAIAAEDAVKLAAPLLTPGEKLRCEFAPPVWINSPDVPPKPLSRYERHRMESLQQQQQSFRPPRASPTKVEVIGDALPFGYVYMEYPPDCDELIFVDPFAGHEKDQKAKNNNNNHADADAEGSKFTVRKFPLRDRVRRYSANDTHADQEQPFWMKTPNYVERLTKKRLREGDALDSESDDRGDEHENENEKKEKGEGGLQANKKKRTGSSSSSSPSLQATKSTKKKNTLTRKNGEEEEDPEGAAADANHKSTITEEDMRDLDAGFVAELEAFLQSGPKKVSLKAITSTEDSEVAKKLLQRAEKRERVKERKQEMEALRLQMKQKKKEKLRNKKKRKKEQRHQLQQQQEGKKEEEEKQE